MTIGIRCGNCQKKLKAPDEYAGRKFKCPNCQTVLTAPRQTDTRAQDRATPLPKAPSEPSEDHQIDDNSPPTDEDAFADDWLNSDQMEDPAGREQRIKARQTTQLEREVESEIPASKKKKASPNQSRASDGGIEQPFRWHWIYLVALLPLAIVTVWPGQSVAERLAETLRKNPELASKMEQAQSLTDLLNTFPTHRIEGALLPRDSLVHWLFGAMSATAYLGLLFTMFPGSRKRTTRLLLVGLFTGTVGIVLLLAFQLIANISGGLRLRGRGLVIVIVLVIQLIGFSYRCAEDPSIGFWGSFFGFTLGVGLCEELCKSIPIWHYLRNAEKTGWRGACLTGLASGIGFGVSEGIMYSGDSYNGLSSGLIYLVRFVSCVSLHAMWSGSVALMMYGNEQFVHADEWPDFLIGLMYYISISMILHGLYDTFLKRDMDGIALLIGIGSYFWMFYLVRKSRGT